jgi:hypothetical protein
MKIPGLSKRLSHTTIAAGTVILVTLLQGVASAQSYQVCTLTNGTATGFFGGVTISGSYTIGANPETSNITAAEAGGYSYTFTGPLNGPGYLQVSQIPPPPCDLEGCTPGTTVGPGVVTFSLYNPDNGQASLSFEDTGELFGGIGTLSCSAVTPPPPQSCSANDSPARRARPDASRSLTVTCGCDVQINLALLGNGSQQIYGIATPVGMDLPSAAQACGYIAFNWQQLVTNLPCPSPFKTNSPGLLPSTNFCGPPTAGDLTAGGSAGSFNDPPNGAYVGQWAGYNPYPFYYTFPDVSIKNRPATLNPTDIVVNNNNTALWFKDIPRDYCLSTGLNFQANGVLFGVPAANQVLANQWCGGQFAPEFSSLGFLTSFVGMTGAPTSALPADPLAVWTWTDTYNGQAGNIAIGPLVPVPSGGGTPVPGTGYGGITITSLNGIPVPPIIPPTQVSMTASGLAYSRVTKTFNGTVTITNISGTTITTPTSFQLALNSLTAGVTLVDSTGTFNQGPYTTVPALLSLFPGQSVTVPVEFSNPSGATINFTPEFYAGSFQ